MGNTCDTRDCTFIQLLGTRVARGQVPLASSQSCRLNQARIDQCTRRSIRQLNIVHHGCQCTSAIGQKLKCFCPIWVVCRNLACSRHGQPSTTSTALGLAHHGQVNAVGSLLGKSLHHIPHVAQGCFALLRRHLFAHDLFGSLAITQLFQDLCDRLGHACNARLGIAARFKGGHQYVGASIQVRHQCVNAIQHRLLLCRRGRCRFSHRCHHRVLCLWFPDFLSLVGQCHQPILHRLGSQEGAVRSQGLVHLLERTGDALEELSDHSTGVFVALQCLSDVVGQPLMQCAVAGAFHPTCLFAEDLIDCSAALGNEGVHRFAHGRPNHGNTHTSAAHSSHVTTGSQPGLVFRSHFWHCLFHGGQQLILAHTTHFFRLDGQLLSQGLSHNMVAQLMQDDGQTSVALESRIDSDLSCHEVVHRTTQTRVRCCFPDRSYCWQLELGCQLIDQAQLFGDLCTWFGFHRRCRCLSRLSGWSRLGCCRCCALGLLCDQSLVRGVLLQCFRLIAALDRLHSCSDLRITQLLDSSHSRRLLLCCGLGLSL